MPRKTIPIYADGDLDRLTEARQAVAVAERRAQEAQAHPRRLGDNVDPDAEVTAAQAAYDKLIDAAAESAEEWIVDSIGHEDWRELVAAHPARKVQGTGDEAADVTHPDDEEWGVNVETFPKALLMWVDPEDDEHRTVLKAGDIELVGLSRRIKRLSMGQFETLWVTAFMLNTAGVNDPKATRFSPSVPRSDET
ncbi:hypothetical protein [Pimelobacter simplex]|uniref:hypothetical protein n=1 Tax=Nocardioides simplex TaxID=2045 RepID=UPI00214FBEC6|nr:hypothetical protein [Pimelobacter simplex]UUW88403.1 hypothetical protein M0M43_22025 [Pimelobacter simplex]UUW97907.1 hypothetical protein M0M48_10670 [Pimelobacter simplex]